MLLTKATISTAYSSLETGGQFHFSFTEALENLRKNLPHPRSTEPLSRWANKAQSSSGFSHRAPSKTAAWIAFICSSGNFQRTADTFTEQLQKEIRSLQPIPNRIKTTITWADTRGGFSGGAWEGAERNTAKHKVKRQLKMVYDVIIKITMATDWNKKE